MTNSRDEAMKELRREVSAKHLVAKTGLVAEKLGKPDPKAGYWDDITTTSMHVFNDAASSLTVKCASTHVRGGDGHSDYYSSDVEVFSKGKRVLKAYNSTDKDGVSGYIPGEWETQLEALYLKAQKPVRKEKPKSKWWHEPLMAILGL